MHIAIEGMDGAGKTTIGRKVAKKLGFEFIEKPLHYLLDEEGKIDNYMKISNYINNQESRILKLWFYGMGNIYIKSNWKDKNVVTDRHLVSNYFWNCDENIEDVFQTLIKYASIPEMTFLLYASPEIRVKRIVKRNPLDKDADNVNLHPEAYDKMEKFLKNRNMKFMKIDTSYTTSEEVSDLIVNYIKKNIFK